MEELPACCYLCAYDLLLCYFLLRQAHAAVHTRSHVVCVCRVCACRVCRVCRVCRACVSCVSCVSVMCVCRVCPSCCLSYVRRVCTKHKAHAQSTSTTKTGTSKTALVSTLGAGNNARALYQRLRPALRKDTQRHAKKAPLQQIKVPQKQRRSVPWGRGIPRASAQSAPAARSRKTHTTTRGKSTSTTVHSSN